jgi:peptide/nickel transport system substrate-binding protein
LKDEFRKAGIEFNERLVEFNVLVNCMLDRKCDAVANSWVAPLDGDPYQVFHSSSIPNRGTNWISFRNTESDRLLEQARAEFDFEKRKQIYWRWQELIHDEQPYTFLIYPEAPVAYHKRFQNVEFIPNRPGYNLSEWLVR